MINIKLQVRINCGVVLLLTTSLISLLSCEKDESNNSDNHTYKVELISGNNQKGNLNQELDSSINIIVKDDKNRRYKNAIISINSENGNFYQDYDFENNEYLIHWLTDCNAGNQSATIVVKDSLERLIDTLMVSCFVEKDSLWNRACGIPVTTMFFEFAFPSIQKIVKSPDGAIFITTYNYHESLYVSYDNGETWEESLNLEAYSGIYDLTINSNGTIFLSTDKGLYKKKLNDSWEKVMEESIDKCFSIDKNTLFACGYLYHIIYRSDDEGETWNTISVPYTNRFNVLSFTESINKISRIDENKMLMLNSDGEMLISYDNGVTWGIFNNTETFWDISGFYILNNNIYLVNISGAESIPLVYKADLQGTNWNLFCTLTSRPSNYYRVSEINSYNDNLFILTDNCIYQINEAGDTLNITNQVWSKIKHVDNFEISSNGNIIVGNQNYNQTGIFYKKL